MHHCPILVIHAVRRTCLARSRKRREKSFPFPLAPHLAFKQMASYCSLLLAKAISKFSKHFWVAREFTEWDGRWKSS